MEVKPHDLIKIEEVDNLVTDRLPPGWVTASLHRAPFVVVRRPENFNGCIPVGIRGPERGQRFAAWLPAKRASVIITPYSLVSPANWKAVYGPSRLAIIRALHRVTPFLQRTGYRWGPTGSTGFELATGVATLKDSSDLDLVLDVSEMITVQEAKALISNLRERASVHLDIQMNTPQGAVALTEYSKSEKVLVKTSSGPVLQHVHLLWS